MWATAYLTIALAQSNFGELCGNLIISTLFMSTENLLCANKSDLNASSETALGEHKGAIRCVEFASEVNAVLTGSWDGTVKMWDSRVPNCVGTYNQGNERVIKFFHIRSSHGCSLQCKKSRVNFFKIILYFLS